MRDMESDKKQWWIFKPSASAQGKGIFITNNILDVSEKGLLMCIGSSEAVNGGESLH